MILFWNPSCGFCQAMLNDLRDWEAAPPAGAPDLLIISRGAAGQNREMSLRSPIVLDQTSRAGQAFGANGTPMALLLDSDGRVSSGLAAGAQAIWELASGGATIGLADAQTNDQR